MSNNDINTNLYETLSNDEYIFKEEIVEFIKDSTKWKDFSTVEQGARSNDWYIPSEPSNYTLEVVGILKIKDLEAKFGNFTDEDLNLLQQDLYERDLKNYFYQILDEERNNDITSFGVGDVTIKINRQRILFEVQGEINELMN